MELTAIDEQLLTKLRLRRLMDALEPLHHCVCLLDLQEVLNIHCLYPSDVDELLGIEATLKETCRIVLGCSAVALWFAHECVYRATIAAADTLGLESEISKPGEKSMVATADRLGIDEAVRSEILPELDALVDREIDAYMSSPELQSEIQQRVRARLARMTQPAESSNGSAPQVEAIEVATPEPAPIKTSTNYTSVLINALTNDADPAAARSMLSQVRRRTKKGVAFLEALVAQYPADRQEKARVGLTRESVLDAAKLKLDRRK